MAITIVIGRDRIPEYTRTIYFIQRKYKQNVKADIVVYQRDVLIPSNVNEKTHLECLQKT